MLLGRGNKLDDAIAFDPANGKLRAPAACDDFARLQAAQDSLIEELQYKNFVSGMVAQAVLRGVLAAVSEENAAALAVRGAEYEAALQEKDHAIVQMKALVSEYLDKMKQQEFYILERERETTRMAESLVDITFRLNAESLKSSSCEKKLTELQAREARKLQQIAALSEQVEKLKAEKSEASEFREVVKERKQAREACSLRQITDLTHELEKIKVEQCNETEMLRTECRSKEQKYREGLEEVAAENERQLVELRAENSAQQAMIMSLAEKQEQVGREFAELFAAHKKSLQLNEELSRTIQEKDMQYKQEVTLLKSILHEQMQMEQQIISDLEADVLAAYFSSLIVEQQAVAESLLENSRKEEIMLQEKINESEALKEACWKKELEAAVLFDCFLGFVEDLRLTKSITSVEERLLEQHHQHQLEMDTLLEFFVSKLTEHARSTDRRRHATTSVEERLLEQHHQHQLEMDTLLEFFVSKFTEHVRLLEDSADFSSVEGDGEVAQLQRHVGALKREKDEIISDKTEEIFRMKRDFFKELDKLKLDGGHYDYGILKRYFTDARQRVHSLLDKAQSESTSNQRFTGLNTTDDHSDADSVTSEPPPPGLESFTEQFLVLASELRNDIDQRIMDTGMVKPEDSQKLISQDEELRNELDSLCKELEQERTQNYALTMEMQQLEHNISLSNGELEKLHGQLEGEKKENFMKDSELDNLKHDLGLLKTQMHTLQGDKLSLEGHIQTQHVELQLAHERVGALETELSNLLKVKASVSGERDRLTEEVTKLKREVESFRNQLCVEVKGQKRSMEKYFVALQHALEEKQARLDNLVVCVEALSRCWEAKDSDFKRRVNWYHRNLRKAEDEVDLLGDENEYYISLLERLYLALNHYEPVLRHYSQISDLSKLIKSELMSRMDSPIASVVGS